ncbi:MAG TPA: tetratricopeptide repeat protein, partial [Minicystis sp.]|nr:tetratricopeptide repeat protein [Minicystis sp.]
MVRKAACITTMVLAAALASVAHVDVAYAGPVPGAADVKKAQQLFRKADELFNAHRYPEALDLFRQSYATVQSPNSHLYIARCLAQMGDLRTAYLEFQKVYEEAERRAATEPKYAPTRDSARVERDELGNKIALVTVSVRNADASTTVKIGDV